MKQIISLGAGVQSSAMLLMAIEGTFGDKPDCAVFADTGWEPKATYEWLDQLEKLVAPFPIHRVSCGRNIRDEAVIGTGGSNRFGALPTYVRMNDGILALGRRQCTNEYKIRPLQKFCRSLGATTKSPVSVWVGISTDEAIRMKPSRVKYIVHEWPLIDAGLSRERCVDYLKSRGYVVPKSSCIGCPFKGDKDWARLRAESPDEFADAVEFDKGVRNAGRSGIAQYIHRSLIPLGDIAEFNHENQLRMFHDAFGNECEGMCGT